MTKVREFVVGLLWTGMEVKEVQRLREASFGPGAMGIAQIYCLRKLIADGGDTNDRRGGSQKKIRTKDFIEALEAEIEADRSVTVRELASTFSTTIRTISNALTSDLGLRKRCARWVPRLLTQEHKDERIRCVHLFKRRAFQEGLAFWDKIITTDESWISFSTPETKEQSRQWVQKGSKAPIKAKRSPIEKKVMVIPFFTNQGLIYTHFVPKGQTINADYFIEVMKTFRVHLRKKRPDIVDGEWILHMDNARPHTSKKTVNYLKNSRIKTIDHPPYSPDLARPTFGYSRK